MSNTVTDRPAVGALEYAMAGPNTLVPVRVYAGEEAGWRALGECVGATVIRHKGRMRIAVVYDAGPEPGRAE